MTLAIVACALALPLLAAAFVALDLGRRFLAWAAARESRVDADGRAAEVAELGRRVAKLERDAMQERQVVGFGRRP